MMEDLERELKSLEYEIKNNSIKRIGTERYGRINRKIGYLKAVKEIFKELDKAIDEEDDCDCYISEIEYIDIKKRFVSQGEGEKK